MCPFGFPDISFCSPLTPVTWLGFHRLWALPLVRKYSRCPNCHNFLLNLFVQSHSQAFSMLPTIKLFTLIASPIILSILFFTQSHCHIVHSHHLTYHPVHFFSHSIP